MLAAIDPASPNFSPGGPGPVGGGPGPGSVAIRPQESASAAAPAGSVALYAPAALGRVHAVGSGKRTGIEISGHVPLYIATPALLAHYGIAAGDIDSNADIITGRSDLAGMSVTGPDGGPTPCDASQPQCRVNGKRPTGSAVTRNTYQFHPVVQRLTQLPEYTSAPDTLLTPRGLAELGLKPVTAGWLIQTPAPLTAAQINPARQSAAAAGVTLETRKSPASYAPLRNGATAIGLLVALGVLAMTVGLIRSETANDLRTLAATGATSTTRRSLTGATAGSLALLGALLGTGGAYAALVAWHRSNLHPLTRVPFVNLAVIVVGLPAIAVVGGWLLAGREPPAIAHRPLD